MHPLFLSYDRRSYFILNIVLGKEQTLMLTLLVKVHQVPFYRNLCFGNYLSFVGTSVAKFLKIDLFENRNSILIIIQVIH